MNKGGTAIEQIKPDWSISELYEKSWELIKKHKVLWIFGMAVAGLTSGTQFNSSGNSRTFDSESFKKLQDLFQNNSQSTPDKITQVLGAATDPFSQMFSLIPSYFYIILGLEILAVVIVGIVISLISSSWSQASLLQAIQTALNNGKPTIRDSSEKAFSSIKPLIWLQIVPTLIFTLISMILFGILIAGIIAFSTGFKILFGILLLIVVVMLIYGLIMLGLSQIWAIRIAVLDKKGGKEALGIGYKLAKKKFWPMQLLGLVNTILTGLIIGVPVLIMMGFVLGGVFSLDTNLSLGIVLLFLGGILFLAFLLGYLLLSGILTAFKASVWSIAYNNIKGKYHHD